MDKHQKQLFSQGDLVVYKITELDFLNVNVEKFTAYNENEIITLSVNSFNITENIIITNQTILNANVTIKDNQNVNHSLMRIGSFFINPDWNYWSEWVGNQTNIGSNSISYSINKTTFTFTISSGLDSDIYYYRVDLLC